MEALAAAVREVRARKRLSQERVAEAAGVDRKLVGRVERAEHVPSWLAVTQLAEGLGVSMAELVAVYELRLLDE